MALRMTITEDRDVVIVSLAARIDSFAIEELYEGFEQVKKTGKRNIVLMMRDLEYINSRGIATLISFFKWAKEEGRSVKLAQVPKNVMALLTLLGIEKLTSIYDTLPEAIESFEQDLAQEEPPEEVPILGEEAQSGRDFAPRQNNTKTLIIAGAAVLVLALVALFFLGQGEKKGPELDLQPLLKKIELLEERIAKLESRGKEAPQVQEKLDSLTRNLNERLSHLEKDINQIKEEAASGKKKAELSQPAAPAPAPPPRTPAKPSAKRFHTVAPGENLYRIALRYSLSVEELRRLNSLRPDQSIQVGQKLNVGPGN
jgi:stage II sporulation protein AA (anti-sigma F factor antagonist)